MDYREWIGREYSARKARNPRYSIRAFARLLGVSKTSLAAVLAGKRHLSERAALRVAEKLGFSKKRVDEMVSRIRGDGPERFDSQFLPVEDDVFRLIADWHHYAILSLAETAEASSEPAWVAARLGLRVPVARAALKRLYRMNLLDPACGTRLIRSTRGLSTSIDVPSAALRRHHAQNLSRAKKSLLEDPVTARDVGSITMAIDPAKLPEAKRRLREVRRELAAFLETGVRSEVYTLAVQLFPNTRPPHATA